MGATTSVDVAAVHAARERIAGVTRATPLIAAHALGARAGQRCLYKLETLQDAGSFKARGAANCVLANRERAIANGVVTASTGNHGRAVGWVADRIGARAVVCMSELSPEVKRRAVLATGAELRIEGASQDDAFEIARRLADEEGMVLVDQLDGAEVIAGHGTIGLELTAECPDLDAVVVPVSAGALIAGVALGAREANPRVRVIGVSAVRNDVMRQSLRAGRPVQLPERPSVADSLGGGIAMDGANTFALVRELVDELVVVEEEEILAGIGFALLEEHQVLEGAAAVGIAAVLAAKVRLSGTTAFTLTGHATDAETLERACRTYTEQMEA